MESEERLDVAMEMLGGRLVGDFVREVWSRAPEAQKEELAKEIMAKVTTMLKSDTYEVRDCVSQSVRRVVVEHIERLIEERKDQIKAAVEKLWPELVQQSAESALKHAVAQVGEKIGRALKGW